jgi:hypothetical protein
VAGQVYQVPKSEFVVACPLEGLFAVLINRLIVKMQPKRFGYF